MKFRKVPGQLAVEVPEGSGARRLMKFRKVMVQIADEVPEGFGADDI